MKKYAGRSDPRLFIIEKRLSNINRLIAVMSPKGGVGKTVFSTIVSIVLSENGYKTGLLDLDFTNPSTHIVLGINPLDYKPVEEKGVIPPKIRNLEYFTIAMYIGDRTIPLRGESIDNIFLEILCIVKWSKLDFLIIDTPPSIRDEHLDILTYLGNKLEVVLITTPSLLAINSTKRLFEILRESEFKIIGLVENMSSNEVLKQFCVENGINYLGSIPYDSSLDIRVGDIVKLRETVFWKNIVKVIEKFMS